MGVRAIRARVQCDRETLEHLWRTHCVFNERLPVVAAAFFAMRRGEIGDTVERRQLARAFVTGLLQQDAKNAYDRVLKATNASAKNATARNALKTRAEKWNQQRLKVSDGGSLAELAELDRKIAIARDYELSFGEFVSGWKPLGPLRERLLDLPKSIEAKLYQEVVAIISGHDELVAIWNKEHNAWLHAKQTWESKEEHRKYLALRPEFDAFEQSAGGKATKRRGRWHLYLEWLRANPGLAAWRGAAEGVHELSNEARQRITKAKPWKTRSVEAEEFWKANPELSALDKLHGYYEREFVRRRKTKRNPDGFDHRPTFTMPNAVNHPRWFVFNAPQTNPSGYRKLNLPDDAGCTGSVELQLLVGDKSIDEKYPTAWTRVSFRCDPRLAQFRRVTLPVEVKRGKSKGETKPKDGFEFFDRHLGKWRKGAEISGVKLMFRSIQLRGDGSLKSAVPYLVFTCSTQDLPLTERARAIEWTETKQLKKDGSLRKRPKLPEGLIACAIDLGLRHVGFATICIYENGVPRVLRSRSIWLDPDACGPGLGQIGRHKREIRRLRRQRGKPVKGENSHVLLQNHITYMGADRFKKAARAIINFAWNADQAFGKKSGEVHPRADVIILEKLEGFIPDAERERGVNRALAAWNRGQLVLRIKEMAEDAGYKSRVYEVLPHGTSQVCSRCGALGRRYSIARNEDTRLADIRFGWVEKLFACPRCNYRANADHNASVNLHRKFVNDSAMDAFFTWSGQSNAETKRQLIEAIDHELRPILRRLHCVSCPELETPF